jgi:DNA mismatch repair protein MutS2
VAFDEENSRPTYQLRYGRPGTSNAFEIAADLGIPPEIIEEARGHLDPAEGQTIDLIKQLTEAWDRAKYEEEKLILQQQRVELAKASLARQREGFVQSREEILSKLRQQSEDMLTEAEKELKSAIAGLQQGGMGRAMAVRKKVREIRQHLSSALESQDKREDQGVMPSAAGQSVRLRTVGGRGTLLKIKNQGRRAEVQMGPKRVEVDMESLELLPDEKSASARAHRSNTVRVFREEPETCEQRLHLVGLRVEEAIPLLDKTLDRAILDGYNQIHVVHGHGTGRLRKAVQEFLTGHAIVKGFRAEKQGAGGTGVTVVELKD